MWIGLLSSVFLSSTFLVLSAFFFSYWKITRNVGNVLLHRSIYCRYNWTHHTRRSVLELGAWFTVLWTTYWHSLAKNKIGHNLLSSSLYGSIFGIIFCLVSEWSQRILPVVEVTDHESSQYSKTHNSLVSVTRNIAMNSYILFSMLYLALMFIFQYCTYLLFAVVLSIFASIVMVLAGDFFSRLETSKIAGNILQDRIQRPIYNWRCHFWRSAFEFTCWQSAIYISFYNSGNIITAIQTGAFVGCLVVLICDSFLRKGEKVKDYTNVTPQILAKLQEILKENRTADLPKLQRSKHQRKKSVYTMEEVAKHNTFEDCWIVYHDDVLDVSGWVRHPGGKTLLERFAGRDATDEIRMYHFDSVLKTHFPSRCIGVVNDAPNPTSIQNDFRQLYAYFVKEGYFEPRLNDYMIKAIPLSILIIMVWVMIVFSNSNAIHFLAAIMLAIFWQQIAFIGHDCGHNGVFCNRDQDSKLGLFIANFLTGITGDWWKATHNVHHAVPNSIYDDPDIAHLPFFAVTPRFFDSIYHTFHHRVMLFDAVARNVLVPYQHILYYPIMCFARFNLYAQSLIRIIKEPYVEKRSHELISVLGFYCWYILLVSYLNSGIMILAFTLLAHACAGILNVQITISHFAMPINEGRESDYGGDFYRRNIIASMDISCSTWMDWFHGGLQFQTLHHVYPRMPRGNVRKSQPFIVALCKKHGIPYKIVSFFDGNMDVINCLRETAQKANIWSPMIMESFNAEG